MFLLPDLKSQQGNNAYQAVQLSHVQHMLVPLYREPIKL